MDPVITPLLVSGGVSLIAALVKAYGESKAQEIANQARDAYGQIDGERLRQVVAEQLGPSALETLAVDPSYRDAQREALAALKNISDSGGMTLTERAQMQQAQDEGAQRERASRMAALQSLRQRGQYSAGAEVAQSALAGQAAANRNAQVGLQASASAQQRALDALRQRAALAGQMGAEDWQRGSQKAQARDAINAANWGARYGRQMTLAGNQMNAALGKASDTRAGWEQGADTLARAGTVADWYARGQYKKPEDEE